MNRLIRSFLKITDLQFKESGHVRISESGRKVMNNTPLASKVVSTVIKNSKELFIYGKTIVVKYNDQIVEISSTTK